MSGDNELKISKQNTKNSDKSLDGIKKKTEKNEKKSMLKRADVTEKNKQKKNQKSQKTITPKVAMNVSVPTMLLTIVARGKASKVLELFEKNGVFFTNILHGNGTASSEILDILGLDTAEKDILISPATHHSAVAIMNEFNDRLGGYNYGKGIACRLRLNAITNLVYKSMEVTSKKMEEQKMTNSEEQYSLIIISVNQGYADEVMAVAKKAGARGGTLVRGRQMETEPTQGLFGSGFAREREIIFILVNNQNRKDILNSINVEHGVRSEACATVFALGVEEIAKLT